MYTKQKKVAQIDAYKKVTDWGAIFRTVAGWTIFMIVIVAAQANS